MTVCEWVFAAALCFAIFSRHIGMGNALPSSHAGILFHGVESNSREH